MTPFNQDALKQVLKVYFIMGSNNCTEKPEEVLKAAIEGGVTLFQYREKGSGALKGDEKKALAKRLQAICRQHHVPFIVNDDIALALDIGADGVHIGQDDEPAESVREKIGDMILGVSVHSREEAVSAQAAGADYFGIGPVFATTTKEDAKPERGTILIEELRKEGFTVPIVGIGGINEENAGTVMGAGADGISVITAISKAGNAAEAARKLSLAVSNVVL